MTAFWNYFIYFAMVAVLFWAAGACAAWKNRKVVAYSATIAGLVVFFSYILIMWISLDRWKSHTNLTHPGKYFRPSKVKIMRPTSPK